MSRAGPAAPAMATPEWRSASKTLSRARWAIVGPSVARLSPAMTTPSAKRRAAIGVPWRSSIGGCPRGAWAAGGSSPTRRSSSVKLGPGPSPGGNIGRLIAWGGYRSDGIPGEGHQPRPPVEQEVVRGLGEQVGVLPEQAQGVVAAHAEDPPHLPGHVLVVHVQAHALPGQLPADGATTVLKRQQFVIFGLGQAERSLQMTLAIGDGFPARLDIRTLCRPVAFGVLPHPLSHSLDCYFGVPEISSLALSCEALFAVVAVAVLHPLGFVEVF